MAELEELYLERCPQIQWNPVNTVNKFGRFNGVAVLPGQGQISDTPYIPLTFRVQLSSLYCAFQKKANSKATFAIAFFAAVNPNYDHKQRTLTHGNTLNGAKFTNHKSQTVRPFEPVEVNYCYLRGPLR